MKYIVIIGDGMADYKLPELNNKTPLEVAYTPNLDFMVKQGVIGTAIIIPEDLSPGSDVGILSVLGYDPVLYPMGRGALEAAGLGIKLKKADVAYRCNLVTLEGDILKDYCAGHISSEEAEELIIALNNELSTDSIVFYPGVSYRHLMVHTGGSETLQCTRPHDIIGEKYAQYLPEEARGQEGKGAREQEVIRKLMERSKDVLSAHPVNQKRISLGKLPANSIWLWGQGKPPSMPKYAEKYGVKGAVISAVDLLRGIGYYAGLDIIKVPGATGYLDTNYKGKALYALGALKDHDFVLIHVEAPDETSHAGDIDGKIEAIEALDSKVIGTILCEIENFREYRMLTLPDHLTPIPLRKHIHGQVPFVAYGTEIYPNGFTEYSEAVAAKSSLHFDKGFRLMEWFIKRQDTTD
ncbi:cofactor-independent phosphoglycerate mutase [Candidatus Poribacteria bacterium]|nr:cofactor-independent phosphoglycerate mutase [Candidatus Poribacteria bacterium]